MGMFKRAAARGVAYGLAATGAVQFPSKQAMDEAADQVADSMGGMPELPPQGADAPPADADVAMIAQKLMEIAQQLMAQGGAGAQAPAAELGKQAAASDLEAVAAEEAVACMDKAAAETGTLAGQGKSTNTPEESAKVDSVGALDTKQRPQGEYLTGVGNTSLDTSAGQIGASKSPTVAPNASPSGENSVTQGTKSAEALRLSINKVANALIGMGGQKGNSMAQAAKNDPVAALDLKNRPLGTYVVEPGGANFSEPQAARVGLEKKPDVTPNASPSGSNSVTEASKTSAEEQEDAAYVLLFKKTAAAVKEHLPSELSEDEKIAAVSAMIGLDTNGRQQYLGQLKEAAEKRKTVPAPNKGDQAAATGGGTLASVRSALLG